MSFCLILHTGAAVEVYKVSTLADTFYTGISITVKYLYVMSVMTKK